VRSPVTQVMMEEEAKSRVSNTTMWLYVAFVDQYISTTELADRQQAWSASIYRNNRHIPCKDLYKPRILAFAAEC
jgi:hypothetical protein